MLCTVQIDSVASFSRRTWMWKVQLTVSCADLVFLLHEASRYLRITADERKKSCCH